MDEYATGKRRLEKLLDNEGPFDRNEATTRLQLVDPLLMDCLGWPPEAITAEDRLENTRTDYQIGMPATKIILEAKKEGKTFELPLGVDDRYVHLSTLLEDPETAEAIKQVSTYCQQRSVPIAIAFNGHQLVAFLASRQDAKPPMDGTAMVFRSLREINDDFKVFWDMLSPAGVAKARLAITLGTARTERTPPQKLSARIDNYPGFRKRTAQETDLKILGQLILLDLADETEVSDDFLRACYCPSGALSQYALVSKEILRSRYALTEHAVSDVKSVTTKKGTNQSLGPDVLAAALSHRPLLLLGDVGVGKTMFLRHLLRIDAADVLKDSLILYLDFGAEPTVAADLGEYIERRIRDQLEEEYEIDIHEDSLVRAVYNKEINKFKKGVNGPLEAADPPTFKLREIDMLSELSNNSGEHIRRCLEHIKGTAERSVVVVLDNVDQRPKSFQEEVFMVGQTAANSWPATVFIALRPKTFYESRLRGSLDAYHSRAFSVYPARTDEVVLKRLRFAKQQLGSTGRTESFPEGLSLDSENLEAYIDVLIKAFSSNTALKELLDNLSGGNLRTALDLLNAFVGSGYVSTERIIEIANKGDIYTIPIHEFVRAITFGESDHFSPAQSPIVNVFDISEDDAREHFLLPNLVLEAHRLGESAGGKGFIGVGVLQAFGEKAGFNPEQVGTQLERAFESKLLEGGEGSPDASQCRATSVGIYTASKLTEMFTYIDAMIVDTPVVDPSVRGRISDVRAILDRINRARIFQEYLDECWTKCQDQNLPFDWRAISVSLRKNIDDAERRAKQAEKRRVGGA